FLLAKTERIGSESIIEEDRFVAAVEWADALGADIISSSVAYRDFDNSDDDYFFEDLDGKTTASARAINWAFKRGILSVITAGNYALYFPQDGGLHTPADAFGALSVGAVNLDGIIASFSSHGPTADGRIKPDMCALGVNTYMADAASPNSYSYHSGTSFSTPLITGAAALVMEKYPDLLPAQIIERLKAYATQVDSPDNRYGWGIPNTALSMFENGSARIPDWSGSENKIYSFPNPSFQNVSFHFRWTNVSPSKKETSISIYNLLGELIWKDDLQPKIVGLNEVVLWNLKNFSGVFVPSGVYFVAVKDGHTTIRGKFLVLH
ncbi:MAG: S8 family peptidase, partial [Candidatus Marinimicrobia bacterium]|nr:S8 family peptidase [Candidatus Neomarinimicrobiota bacterium]